MNKNYEEEVATGRLTPRQIKRGISAKNAAYGKKNNGRTGYVDKTTANKLSTTHQTEEEKAKRAAAEKKENILSARRLRRKASLERKSAPVEVEPIAVPKQVAENYEAVFECEVIGPSVEEETIDKK